MKTIIMKILAWFNAPAVEGADWARIAEIEDNHWIG